MKRKINETMAHTQNHSGSDAELKKKRLKFNYYKAVGFL